MIRLDFQEHLTALQIRDPAVDVCREVAANFDLHANFRQPQQRALSGYYSRYSDSKRERIGNGKHKDWYIDYQIEPTNISNPTVVGTIALRGPFDIANRQYGGFDYGKHGELIPKYSHITVHTPSELELYRPIDPEPDILAMTYQGLRDHFENGFPRLFDVSKYTV